MLFLEMTLNRFKIIFFPIFFLIILNLHSSLSSQISDAHLTPSLRLGRYVLHLQNCLAYPASNSTAIL